MSLRYYQYIYYTEKWLPSQPNNAGVIIYI